LRGKGNAEDWEAPRPEEKGSKRGGGISSLTFQECPQQSHRESTRGLLILLEGITQIWEERKHSHLLNWANSTLALIRAEQKAERIFNSWEKEKEKKKKKHRELAEKEEPVGKKDLFLSRGGQQISSG